MQAGFSTRTFFSVIPESQCFLPLKTAAKIRNSYLTCKFYVLKTCYLAYFYAFIEKKGGFYGYFCKIRIKFPTFVR